MRTIVMLDEQGGKNKEMKKDKKHQKIKLKINNIFTHSIKNL
jgi:hypothetical protein